MTKLFDEIYFWLFFRASKNRLAMWSWRKWTGILTSYKHVKRKNWKESIVWLKWIVTPTKKHLP